MGRSPRTFVASCRRARRRAGDALWAAGYPARRGLHSTRARLAGWRLGRPDALVPLQVRWARASGDRRAAAAVRGPPNAPPSPPRDFDNGGRRNVAPRAHVPFGGGPGTREPSRDAPRPGAPSGEDGAAPQPAPAPPPPAGPPAEVPATPPVGTTPEVPEPDEDGGPGRGNGPPLGGPPGQGGGDGDKPDGD